MTSSRLMLWFNSLFSWLTRSSLIKVEVEVSFSSNFHFKLNSPQTCPCELRHTTTHPNNIEMYRPLLGKLWKQKVSVIILRMIWCSWKILVVRGWPQKMIKVTKWYLEASLKKVIETKYVSYHTEYDMMLQKCFGYYRVTTENAIKL